MPLVRKSPMRGDFTTCTATSWSGATIITGPTIIRKVRLKIHAGLRRGCVGFFAVGIGMARQKAVCRIIGFMTIRRAPIFAWDMTSMVFGV